MRKTLFIILLIAVAAFGWTFQKDFESIVSLDTLTATDTTLAEDLTDISLIPGGTYPEQFIVLISAQDSAYTDSTYGLTAVSNTATVRVDAYVNSRWFNDILDTLIQCNDANYGTVLLEIDNNKYESLRFITSSNIGWIYIFLAYRRGL